MRKTSWSLTISIAILALTFGVVTTYFLISENERQCLAQIAVLRDEDNELAELLQFLNHFRTNHYFYDEDNDLIRGAIEGMVLQANDPWARLLSVEEYWSIANPLFGGFSGIGVRVEEVDGYAIIIEVLRNSPAEKYGLLIGDAIIRVEGETFAGNNFEEVLNELLGASRSVVNLEIQRANDLFDLNITREYIAYESVVSNVFEHENKIIGYIRIANFGMNTQSDFSDAIAELEKAEIDGLIIDMRDNPGGSMATLNTMVNYLLPTGRTIMRTINRHGRENTQTTRGDDNYRLDVEIVTLINGGSASASEIFAAAMIESGEFEVIGTTSFGKGTVQTPLHIGDNILLSTIQEGLSPSGEPIEGFGIKPTIYVEIPEFHDFLPLHLGRDVVLEYDMVDTRILNAQLILEVLGHYTNRTDGYFDATTVKAVRSFQQSNNLSETGYINPETATALSVALFEKMRNPAYDTQLLAAFEFFTTATSRNFENE